MVEDGEGGKVELAFWREARESLYWIDLFHRNSYLDDKQYESIYNDAEELVKILVARCKKINQELDDKY